MKSSSERMTYLLGPNRMLLADFHEKTVKDLAIGELAVWMNHNQTSLS